MELLSHLKNPGSLHLPSLLSPAWTAPWLQSLHILYSDMTASRKRKVSSLPVCLYWGRMLPFPETPSKLPVTKTGVTCSTLSHSLEWDQHDWLRPVIYSWNWVMWRKQYLNKSRIFGRQPRMSATGSLLWFFFFWVPFAFSVPHLLLLDWVPCYFMLLVYQCVFAFSTPLTFFSKGKACCHMLCVWSLVTGTTFLKLNLREVLSYSVFSYF